MAREYRSSVLVSLLTARGDWLVVLGSSVWRCRRNIDGEWLAEGEFGKISNDEMSGRRISTSLAPGVPESSPTVLANEIVDVWRLP